MKVYYFKYCDLPENEVGEQLFVNQCNNYANEL